MRFAVGLCAALFIASIGSCHDDPVKPLQKPKDTVAPFVTYVGLWYKADSINIDYSPYLCAVFSEKMDLGSINQNTFLLKKDTLTIPCRLHASNFDSSAVVSIVPDSLLEFSTTYTINITSGCNDVAGNELTPERTWSFTTVPPSGRVEGFATDYDLGDPVGGCAVVASTSDTAVTDGFGQYSFPLLPVGTHTVTVSQHIYTLSSKQIEVTPYGNARYNFQLRTNEVGEPNDNFSMATPIYTGIPCSNYIRVGSDLDFFSISANASDTLLIGIEDVHLASPCFLQCDVFDPLHALVESSSPVGLQPGMSMTMIVEMTGNYYIRFKSKSWVRPAYNQCCNNNEPYEFIVYVRQPTTGLAPGSKYE